MQPERVIRIDPPRVEDDRWVFVLDASGDLVPDGALVLPFEAWRQRSDQWAARRQPTGVWLAPGDDPEALAAHFSDLSLIAVQFPKAADGRGYSSAVLLRRLGYTGELRAFGDVARDQLYFLRRCGFDAFTLAPGRAPEAALAAFSEFSLAYQRSVDEPQPLFRRRNRALHG